jgi:DNA-binding LacI/PurR family transcriptional regulator
MGMKRRATIVDVASAVGVSRQTVTRAMNDMSGISGLTKQRVLDAARELGYRPSRFGRGLVKSGQQTVGLMVHNLTNPYYPELAAAVVSHAARQGWSVVLLDLSEIEDQRAFLTALAPQVDALLGYVTLPRRELGQMLPGVPVVEIDAPSRSMPTGWGGVEFDLTPGVREAVTHLIDHGISQPIVLDSSQPGKPSARAKLILKEWRNRGIDAPVIHGKGDDVASAEIATVTNLDQVRRADAIMAFNDYCAFGAMKALRRHGLHVPDDIKVVGVDGLSAGTYTTPELTTLGVDMNEAAQSAISILRSMFEGDSGSTPPRRRLRHHLILRESA